MKKYIKPISKLVNLENENILAGSGELNRSVGDGNVLGKKNDDIWDDDEDF